MYSAVNVDIERLDLLKFDIERAMSHRVFGIVREDTTHERAVAHAVLHRRHLPRLRAPTVHCTCTHCFCQDF